MSHEDLYLVIEDLPPFVSGCDQALGQPKKITYKTEHLLGNQFKAKGKGCELIDLAIKMKPRIFAGP